MNQKIKKNNILLNFLSEKKNFFMLNQLIVHIQYGIGKYIGLCTLKIQNKINEYIIIIYAKNTKLYVPITSLHLIHEYHNQTNSIVPLSMLGQSYWKKEKKKNKKKIYDFATKLLDIYSKRLLRKGFSFLKNKNEYKKFCNMFPYKMTQDQSLSMKQVLNDMKKPIPMDRLICGDVGFGKTEIAIRATFIALSNFKQVAILVPTTLLAKQHFGIFKNRFQKYLYNIEILTRLVNIKKEKKIIKQLKNGKIQLIIGTHKILSDKIKWNNLGLLIIDEEHRFGVYHKEKIKEFNLNIDILTLTATPIPRTLNISLLGLRDLSIISQPIYKRLKIKTFVEKYNIEKICNIILKEINRGGQVYYLYNSVKKIKKKAKYLSMLIPEAKICIIHGKMSGNNLHHIMKNFSKKIFNVLVCTTIIDTGLDIGNVNTIIIENADKFGLSQLHQLRGRVGRSENQAYAWFFIPNFKKITTNAKKRLKIIQSLQELGSGFQLSKHDHNIRGVGEILGDSQSGNINNIGIFLYKKFLYHAIQNIKKNKNFLTYQLSEKYIDIQLHASTLLPETYIQDVNIRLSYYRKISYVNNINKLKKIKIELFQKFGILPIYAKNLFLLNYIKIIANFLKIKKIVSQSQKGYIKFSKKNKINTLLLSKIIIKDSNIWKIKKNKLYFTKFFLSDYKRLQWIWNWLKKLIIK